MLLVNMIFNTIQSTTLFSLCKTTSGKSETTRFLFDKIVQVDPNGNVLWSWDTYNYIPLSEASPFNETATIQRANRGGFHSCELLLTGTTTIALYT